MSEEMTHTYWCGWEVPADVPGDHMLDKWPPGTKGWLSGWGGENLDERIYAGRVDASSPEEAEQIVRGFYTKSGSKIRMRWEPAPHPLGYCPSGGRFPE